MITIFLLVQWENIIFLWSTDPRIEVSDMKADPECKKNYESLNPLHTALAYIVESPYFGRR